MVTFKNDGLMDIRAVSTFGVSVKSHSSAIGFFGTGLKYAIAVSLRHGQRVQIDIGGDTYDFSTSKISMREKDFDIVCMSKNGSEPVELGFTTELGKQWALWMAYREFYCNCMDEGGVVSNEDITTSVHQTSIFVIGPEFEQLFEQQDDYFLNLRITEGTKDINVHERPTTYFYYKGIRIAELNKEALFTYDVKCSMELTEDRTLKNSWSPAYYAAGYWITHKSQKTIEKILLASKDSFEGNLDFNGWNINPSNEFLAAVESLSKSKLAQINDSAVACWKRLIKKNLDPVELVANPVIQKTLTKAVAFCKRHGYPVDTYPIKLAENLGHNCLGLAENDTIYVSEAAFRLGGTKCVVATLIEEYVHLKYGFADMTRDMQNYLFDRLVSTLENIDGDPL